jgi:excinuclease ABC subunit C
MENSLAFPSLSPAEVNRLPENPGVYRYYNSEGKLIYVGKAKNLRKRVSSYFTKQSGVDRKTRRMVSEINRIEFAIVNSEFDALLLENSFIKTYQPRYNILMRDDKTYPYIIVTKEPFPRIYQTRKVIPNTGTYFGPFASVVAMKTVLELIRKLYKVRTCHLHLSEENIQKKKFKVCLEYHIGNCLGPCEGLQKESNYLAEIELASHILKGNLSQVRNWFKDAMQEAASKLEFERAQEFKNKIDLLEKYQAKSQVVNAQIDDIEVFGLVSDEKTAFLNYIRVKNGMVMFTKSMEIKKKLDEKDEDILPVLVVNLRETFGSASKEILSNVQCLIEEGDFKIHVPRIGDKKKLVDLAVKNALYFKKEKLLLKGEKEPRENKILRILQSDLQLKTLPDHIECFDNSNIQGSHPVAAMVCFKNGKPSKSDYRHYTIKTVEGPNDFASMEEVVGRRYARIKAEGLPLPKLIVIDGGKGQLSSAVAALKSLDIYGEIPIIGIAKRLEEIYFPEDPYPLHIEKKSPSLMLLQRIRDEAHRFAITHHRNVRSKSSFKSALEEIPGIGVKTMQALLREFKTINGMKEAGLENIQKTIGKAKAEIVWDWLKK